MNKKITPRIIRTITAQALIVIIAVTSIGAAAIVHNEFKDTANKNNGENASSVTESEKETQKSEVNKTTVPEENTTDKTAEEETPENSDYEYAYAGFNPKTTDVNVDFTRILVNGDYQLPEGYKPTLAEAVKGTGVLLDYRVAPYYQAMYDAAKKDGITLTPVSGYRSVERQKTNFENKIQYYIDQGMDRKKATVEAATIIMLPGASEHNAGLAMDIASLSQSFENTDEFEWLSRNAADYGFILRYPKDEAKREITKVIYEPWHYRYVGVEAAQEITRKGITLEEYLGVN